MEHDEEYCSVAEELGLYTKDVKTMAKAYTISAMREKFRCARIDDALLDIMRNEKERKELENLLVTKYLTYEPPTERKYDIAMMIVSAICLAA